MWYEASWKFDIESKSPTNYLNPLVLNFGRSHHIWSNVGANIRGSGWGIMISE